MKAGITVLVAMFCMVAVYAGFPAETLSLNGMSSDALKNGRFHKGYRCVQATQLLPVMTMEQNLQNFSGEELTVVCWVAPLEGKRYRTIVFRGDRKNGNFVDFKLGLFDLFPEFTYTYTAGEKSCFGGVMYAGKIIYCGEKQAVPIQKAPRLLEKRWNFIAAVFNRGKTEIFLNGKKVLEAQNPVKKLSDKGSCIQLGSGQYPGGGDSTLFNGLIGDVRIVGKAMSFEELEAFRKSTMGAYGKEEIDMAKTFVPPVSKVKLLFHLKGTDNPCLSGANYDLEHKTLVSLAQRPVEMKVEGLLPEGKQHAFTLSSWIMPTSMRGSGNYRTIMFCGKRSPSRTDVAFKFGLFGDKPEFAATDWQNRWHGILRAEDNLIVSGSSKIELKNAPGAVLGTWNHLAVTFNYGEVAMYLNGRKIHTAFLPMDFVEFKKRPVLIGLGKDSGGVNAFALNGLLNHVRMYSGALTDKAVKALYEEEKKTVPTQKDLTINRKVPPEYDPLFKNKLEIVKKYEADLPKGNMGNCPASIEIREHKGIYRIFRNSKPENSMCFMPEPPTNSKQAFLAARDFAAAGVNYFSDIFFTFLDWGDNAKNWWKGYGKYDFSVLEKRMQLYIDANPNARLILRIKVNAPKWWLKENPEERAANHKGVKAPQPSLSSEKYIADAAKMLGDVVYYLERSRFAPYIVGYLPAGGECSEWYWWGVTKGMSDYSKINTNAFRKYLKKQYSSVAALREAWKNDTVSFENAEVPPEPLRKKSEDGFFRKIEHSRQVYDYRKFMTEATVNAVLAMNRAVRKNQVSGKLCGAFYGYSMTTVRQLDNLGFCGLKQVLDDPGVDFLCAPTSYDRRGGKPGEYVMNYLGSLRLRKKIYYDEADMRTYLYQGPFWGCCAATEKETLEVHWRTFGQMLTKGTNVWWFLLTGNASFHTNNIMNDIAKMTKLENELMDVSKKPVAEVAVFCDEESFNHVNSSHRLCEFVTTAKEMISYAGMPHDTFLLSDIGHKDMKDYKLYIFLNAYTVSDKLRETIHLKLAKNKATALWVYAPGYLNGVKQMEMLTGMKIDRIGRLSVKDFAVAAKDHALATNLPEPEEQEDFVPGFSVNDKNALTVAKMDGKNIMAVKKTPFGTSIYTLLYPTKELVRNAARMAGVHLYTDSFDTVSANENFIMLHARTGGKKNIFLPGKRKVKNLRTDVVYPETSNLTIDMGQGETLILQLL